MTAFTCDQCRAEFESEVPEAQALAEERETFGFNSPPSDRAVLCDDCYADFAAWLRTRELGVTS